MNSQPSSSSPVRGKKVLRATSWLAIPIAGAMVLVAGQSAVAAPVDVTVTAADIQDTRPVDGGWWADEGAAGTFAVTQDSFDSSTAMKLTIPDTSAKVYLYKDYPIAERPTDLAPLLDGASYTYSGANVNFQIEMVFLPTDVTAYGAQGTTPCTSAVAWGLSTDPDACYTVLKWEPFEKPTTWKTVDLTQGVAADRANSRGRCNAMMVT